MNTKRTRKTESHINYGNNKDVISVGPRSIYIPPEYRCTEAEIKKSLKLMKDESKGKKKKEKPKKKVVRKRVALKYRKKEYKISKLKTGKFKVLVNGEEQTNVSKVLRPIYKHLLKKDGSKLDTRTLGREILKSFS